MSRKSRLLSAVCLGAAAMAAFASVSSGNDGGPARRAPHLDESTQPGRVIVKFRDRAHTLAAATNGGARLGPQSAALLSGRTQLALTDGRILGPRTQVLTAESLNSEALAARLAQDADVEWAVVDHRRFALSAPNDSLYPQGLTFTTPAVGQWYLRAPGGTGNPGVASGINVEPAWNITYGDGIVIADLDTGITAHPDLQNKMFYNGTVPYGYDFVGYGANEGQAGILTANDGDGDDPDPSDPGDWITAAENAGTAASGVFKDCAKASGGTENSSWHGTQTAGIIAAQTGNGAGMAGVARNAMLVPVRVLGKCGGYDSDIQAGMQWAAGIQVAGVPANVHPARVLNMSLGGGSGEACSAAYQDVFDALTARNVIAVVAAGNDEGLAVGVPASCRGAVVVAALRHQGDKVGFSDIGPQVTLSSPGGNCVNTDANAACLYPILTTLNTGTQGPLAPTYSTSFGEVSIGTSFATPIVSGTVGLMLSANPGLTNAQVISMLKQTATPFPTSGGAEGAAEPMCLPPSSTPQDSCYCTTTTCGAGMLNAASAVNLAAGVTGALATISVPPTPGIGDDVTLDSAGSAASTGATITNYEWSITQGASLVTIVGNASGPTATTLALHTTGAGSVRAKLVVTDSAGKIGVSFRSFAVTIPTAVITGPTTLKIPGSIQLSGTASTGGGSNQITSYLWSVTSGSTVVALSAPTNASTVTVVGGMGGTAVVQLVVTDSAGQTATTSTTITASTNSGGGGGGGGGAANPLWLLALAFGGLALAPRRRSAAR